MLSEEMSRLKAEIRELRRVDHKKTRPAGPVWEESKAQKWDPQVPFGGEVKHKSETYRSQSYVVKRAFHVNSYREMRRLPTGNVVFSRNPHLSRTEVFSAHSVDCAISRNKNRKKGKTIQIHKQAKSKKA